MQVLPRCRIGLGWQPSHGRPAPVPDVGCGATLDIAPDDEALGCESPRGVSPCMAKIAPATTIARQTNMAGRARLIPPRLSRGLGFLGACEPIGVGRESLNARD